MTPAEIMGDLSYSDGLRLMNQSFIDCDSKHVLKLRSEEKRVDRKRLFG